VIHVVGGTYRELCTESRWDQLFGSGFRAAAAIGRLGPEVHLSTFLGATDLKLARLLAHGYRFTLTATESSQTLRFAYAHGLAIPHVTPPIHTLPVQAPLSVTAQNVVLFGMVEGDALINAERVVHDPQSAYSPRLFHANGSKADEVAIVCNAREALLLTGKSDAEAAAHHILKSGDAKLVVVKCGSAGAILVTDAGTHRIPVYKTPRVWPIGSGDVFSAVFAFGWAVERLHPIDAAHLASKATAYYCSTQSLPVLSASELDVWLHANGVVALHCVPQPREKMIYLAGPFFSMMERWLIEQSRDALMQQGMHVFSPIHDVGIGDAHDVVPQDLTAISRCDIVFALLDHLDSGTLFEVGYARSLGKAIVGFCQNETPEALKMLSGSGCAIFDDFVTSIYQTSWLTRIS